MHVGLNPSVGVGEISNGSPCDNLGRDTCFECLKSQDSTVDIWFCIYRMTFSAIPLSEGSRVTLTSASMWTERTLLL